MSSVLKILLLVAMIVLAVAGCGRMPIYRWNAGSPTSFALADGTLVPVDPSIASRSVGSASLDAGTVPVKDYGELNITFRNDSTAHRAHYESLGTFIGSYTPESFPVLMVKVAALKADSDDGFWILQTNEGVFGETEFLDFKDPVFIEDNLLWQPGDYEMLVVTFDIGTRGAGRESIDRPVRVTVPGYTDAELPNLHASTSEPVDGEWRREYAGDNQFLLIGLDRPDDAKVTTFYMFRSEIQTGEVLQANWWEYPDGSPVPGAHVSDGSDGLEPGEIYGGRFTENPHRIPWYSGNSWFVSQPYGAGSQPDVWADIPFQGLSIGEATKALEIVIRWDLDNIIELWDFGSEGKELILAPDFMDRFSMEVRQIQ